MEANQSVISTRHSQCVIGQDFYWRFNIHAAPKSCFPKNRKLQLNSWISIKLGHVMGLDEIYVRVLDEGSLRIDARVQAILANLTPANCHYFTRGSPVIVGVQGRFIRGNLYSTPSTIADHFEVLDADSGIIYEVSQNDIYKVPAELYTIPPTIYRVAIDPSRVLCDETILNDLRSQFEYKLGMKMLRHDLVPEVIFDVPYINTEVTDEQKCQNSLLQQPLRRGSEVKSWRQHHFDVLPEVPLPEAYTLVKHCKVQSISADGLIFVSTPELDRGLPDIDPRYLSRALPRKEQLYVGVQSGRLHRVIMKSAAPSGFRAVCVDSNRCFTFRELFSLPAALAIPPRGFLCRLDPACASLSNFTLLESLPWIDIIITQAGEIPLIRAFINGLAELVESPAFTDWDLDDLVDDDVSVNIGELNISLSEQSACELTSDSDCVTAKVYDEIKALHSNAIERPGLQKVELEDVVSGDEPDWPSGILKTSVVICTYVHDYKNVTVIESEKHEELLKMEAQFKALMSDSVKMNQNKVTEPIEKSLYIAEVNGILQRVVFLVACPERKGFYVERYDRGGSYMAVNALYDLPEMFRVLPKFCRVVKPCDHQIERLANFMDFKNVLMYAKDLSILVVKEEDPVSEAFFHTQYELLDFFEANNVYKDSQIIEIS